MLLCICQFKSYSNEHFAVLYEENLIRMIAYVCLYFRSPIQCKQFKASYSLPLKCIYHSFAYTYKLIPSKPAPKPIWSAPATFRMWFKWAENMCKRHFKLKKKTKTYLCARRKVEELLYTMFFACTFINTKIFI